MNAPQINVDLSKLKKKGNLINEGSGGSSSANFKTAPTINPKDKGKSIHVEPYT